MRDLEPDLLDAVRDLRYTNGKGVEYDDVFTPFNFDDALLALARLYTILVILLEEAV